MLLTDTRRVLLSMCWVLAARSRTPAVTGKEAHKAFTHLPELQQGFEQQMSFLQKRFLMDMYKR